METKVLGINSDWGRPHCDGKYGGVGWYRIINPLEKIGADVIRGEFTLKGLQTAVELKERGDVWVIKPMDSMNVLVELFTDRDFAGTKIVLDLDDDPFNLNKDHPARDYFVEKKPLYEYVIENADRVIVSTSQIKDVIKHLNNKIDVIPNSIDTKIWEVTPKKHKNIRIGWFGSGSHMVDLPIILPVIEALEKKYQKVEFHIIGITSDTIKEGRRFHHPPTKGYEEYPQFVADMGIDIAIAPLMDTKFNRAKTNIKWLEHSMLKTPMVLSNVTPYKECVEHGKTGFLAKTTEDWIKYLSALIEDEKLRKEIGENAKKAVLKDWTIDKFLPRYKEVIEKVRKKDIVVYTSVTKGFDTLKTGQNTKGADFVAFTDQKSDVWNTKKPYSGFRDERRNSRIAKILPHLYFQDYKYSIYIDGNIELKVPAQKVVDEWLKDKDVAVFRHIGRDCVYDEAEACVKLNKESPQVLAEQVKEYAKRGIGRHAGLAECGVIVRRHTKDIERMNEKWWAEYCRFGVRDQVSFPVAFDLDKVNLIESSVWRHPYFKFYGHD